jgi:hypothetical protein
MSATDPTLADRSRRHRAAVAQREDAILALLRDLAEEVRLVHTAVDNLGASRTAAVDKPLRNGSADSADSSSVAQRRRAPARARGDVAPAPYGGLGATRNDVREDAWRVLRAMDGRAAHLGSIRDALGDGWDLPRIVAALAHAQAQGQVRREEGNGPRPDRWVPCLDPILEEAAQVPPVRGVDPAPTLHVACSDYSAHATHHQWDPVLAAFVCQVCGPIAPGAVPPAAPGASTPAPAQT